MNEQFKINDRVRLINVGGSLRPRAGELGTIVGASVTPGWWTVGFDDTDEDELQNYGCHEDTLEWVQP